MTDRLDEALRSLERLSAPISWGDVEARRDAAPPMGEDPVVVALDSGSEAGRTSGRRTRLLVAALIVLVAGALVGAFAVAREDPKRPTRTGPGPSPSTPTSRPGTTAPTVPPTQPVRDSFRVFPVTAWTGQEYLVWSGEAGGDESAVRADGWSYNPSTDSSGSVPAAPIAARSEATGVWMGRELIVCCGSAHGRGVPSTTATAAAYEPKRKVWRRLANPPADAAQSFGATVWTGREMIVVVASPGRAFAFDPSTNTWRRLADPPALTRVPRAVWTGREVVVWSADAGQAQARLGDRGYRYAPATGAWSELPALPDNRRTAMGSMVWTGTEIIAWGSDAHDDTRTVGNRWRPGDTRWRPMDVAPLAPVDAYDGTLGSQQLVWDEPRGRLVVWPVQGGQVGVPSPVLEYDPTKDTWRRIGSGTFGYHPDLTLGAGRLLRPSRTSPVALVLPR